MNTGQPTTS